MSTSEIQKQLRDAVDTACNELEWCGKQDLEERCEDLRRANRKYTLALAWDLEHIRELAEMCGVARGSVEAMMKGIRDHIEFLASQCQDDRVETAECGFTSRVDELADRVRVLERQVEGLQLEMVK